MTDLEKNAAELESAGWTVERPAFDDPYEVMYRKMMREPQKHDPHLHPEDDPMSESYDFGEWDRVALAFLKKHFVLKPNQ